LLFSSSSSGFCTGLSSGFGCGNSVDFGSSLGGSGAFVGFTSGFG
jgi:hypothetical protein